MALLDKAGIAEHRTSITELEGKIDTQKLRIRSFGARGAQAAARIVERATSDLASNLQNVHEFASQSLPAALQPWEAGPWGSWQPAPSESPSVLRVGAFVEGRSNCLLPNPMCQPLIGSLRPIVIASRGAEQATMANSVLQSILMRTAIMFPHQSRYTLLDPAGNGIAFPMSSRLDRVSPATGDVRRDLDQVTLEIQRIISTYIDASTPSFELIDDEMRLNEAFHFVFVADFPNRYDLRAAEALQSIARTGPKAGVYVVMHANQDHSVSGEYERYALENPSVISLENLSTTAEGVAGSMALDGAPSAGLQDIIFKKLRDSPRRDQSVDWEKVGAIPQSRWWTGSAEDRIEAPIGRHGANRPLNIWFGTHETEVRPCVHGVLGAMPGAGKSTLFHNTITSLAIRYSPEELRLYLIDGKFGVEFQPYRELPHAEVVSLRTSPDLSRSVLAELGAEMGRRNATFIRHKLSDLKGYRNAGSPEGRMPRLLLVIDEYQQLFDGDKDGEASASLLRISQQGRSAGIHMLLASQRFDSSAMLHRTDIFGNIHLRIAMQIAQPDIAALVDFGPKGRRLISATCDQPGRLVLNDRAGDDDKNVAGKAAFLPSSRRDDILRALRVMATKLPPGGAPRTIVFNGHAQPELIDNPLLGRLCQQKKWLTPDELEGLARSTIGQGGLEVSDWLAAERPSALFFGQEFNVRGHSMAVLRRRPNEHVMVIGERHQERVAMVAAAMLSGAAAEGPAGIEFWVSDRSVLRTQWARCFLVIAKGLRDAGYKVQYARTEEDSQKLIEAGLVEVNRRRAMPEESRIDEPTIILVLSEPDRIGELSRTTDDFGFNDSTLGVTLRQIIAHGPAAGVHLIASASSVGTMKSVLGEKSIQNDFRHRIAMQMSEDDSFGYIRSSAAFKLQTDDEPRPISALLFDSQRQRSVKFKPYSIEPPNESEASAGGTFIDQVATLTAGFGKRAL